MAKSALEDYREKRDFGVTPEPKGEESFSTQQDEPVFTIHRHSHTREQYFLRLESHGVLKSWRIPEGIPLDPNQEQFARKVENYPLSYIEFEGEIPRKGFNAGEVEICDQGTYENIKVSSRKTIQKDIKEGKIQIWLEGDELEGGFEFKKFNFGEEKWLFKKLKDKYSEKGAEQVF
ncbi:MAG: DNA polymerase ligase N-terminal domain-containing protein [Candidatus Paceibacteria bacterium]